MECASSLFFFSFFNCYFGVPQPTLGHSEGDSLTNAMLITAFVQVQPEGFYYCDVIIQENKLFISRDLLNFTIK